MKLSIRIKRDTDLGRENEQKIILKPGCKFTLEEGSFIDIENDTLCNSYVLLGMVDLRTITLAPHSKLSIESSSIGFKNDDLVNYVLTPDDNGSYVLTPNMTILNLSGLRLDSDILIGNTVHTPWEV
ncbi:hypothetical protein RFEPED_0752 [Rickettsia felis str. Pedreira]|uniref:Uncharacterized protein n=2 Tax=Rickettsia felis TaxID=42862 RepID=A0A0F3MRU2_RICFI|nr:hypothetical protein [Rickettsia felis]AAY61166.1 unknown [Rickettsia felis URRWXCal2]KHO04026.1 hypothetical protein JS61_01745 [Rickettsia felis]KJV58371.1 hypothetical protein RFEPED_0752 [Rickettsia felis str. Pedreira]MDE8612045.1 hypothetical protein [Rickettsia felis]